MKKVKGLCNCGLNRKQVPHSNKVCAATHIKRLQQMYRYFLEWHTGNPVGFNLSGVEAHRRERVTAFPALLINYQTPGCLICGKYVDALNGAHQQWIRPKVYGWICAPCNARNFRMCPKLESFCETRRCQRWDEIVHLVALVLRRHGVPRDVRLIVRRMYHPTWPRCAHYQKSISLI